MRLAGSKALTWQSRDLQGCRDFQGNCLAQRNPEAWGRECGAGASGDACVHLSVCAGDTWLHVSSCPCFYPVSAGGRNMSLWGCGSHDLCSTLGTEGLLALPGHRLAGRPHCSTSQRAVIDAKCHSGVAPGLPLPLPVLVAALVTAALF